MTPKRRYPPVRSDVVKSIRSPRFALTARNGDCPLGRSACPLLIAAAYLETASVCVCCHIQVENLRRLRKLVDALEHIEILLATNASLLDKHPLLAFQFAMNGPDRFPITIAAQSAWRRGLEVRPFFTFVNKPQVWRDWETLY